MVFQEEFLCRKLRMRKDLSLGYYRANLRGWVSRARLQMGRNCLGVFDSGLSLLVFWGFFLFPNDHFDGLSWKDTLLLPFTRCSKFTFTLVERVEAILRRYLWTIEVFFWQWVFQPSLIPSSLVVWIPTSSALVNLKCLPLLQGPFLGVFAVV